MHFAMCLACSGAILGSALSAQHSQIAVAIIDHLMMIVIHYFTPPLIYKCCSLRWFGVSYRLGRSTTLMTDYLPAQRARLRLVLFGLILDEGTPLLLPVGQLHHDGGNVGEANILELLGRQRGSTAAGTFHVYLAVHIDPIGIAK
jgi:hypothetical protein